MTKWIELPKKKILIVSATAVGLISAIIITIACLNLSKPSEPPIYDDEQEPQATVGAFAEITETTASITEEPEETTVAATEETTEPAATTAEPSLLFESGKDNTCIVIGIGTYSSADLCIPSVSPNGDTVVGIADGAFENCRFIESVEIPSTIKDIGSGAFVGCSALKAFNVNTSNTKYCSVDGVLFTKDKTILVCYPSNRAESSYLLSTNITEISAYAFDNPLNLRSLLYEGSASKFDSIEIQTGNGVLSTLSVTCNYKNPNK